jgi:hypothetical protein
MIIAENGSVPSAKDNENDAMLPLDKYHVKVIIEARNTQLPRTLVLFA